jgi:hypothetical protein
VLLLRTIDQRAAALLGRSVQLASGDACTDAGSTADGVDLDELIGRTSTTRLPFGARADNPTRLDRPYWALIASLTVLATAAGVLVRARRGSRGDR